MAEILDPSIVSAFAKNPELLRSARVQKSENDLALLPTAETALFVLAGDDFLKRAELSHCFDPDHLFYKESVLDLGTVTTGESSYNGVISITPFFRDLFLYGQSKPPRFSAAFPAELISSKLDWPDMILNPDTAEMLDEAKAFVLDYHTMSRELNLWKHSRPGCRLLFFGESGTGKTLAATLLGKELKRDVYRVDLSAVVSKYVGETSQRLEALLTTAERKNWVLFFDEGDALFGQRSNAGDEHTSTSHYANQEIAFLLQRIEHFDGIIIVATNLVKNIDDAFIRRFEVSVNFRIPDAERQVMVWQRNLSPLLPLANEALLPGLIKNYSLAPASIIKIIQRMYILSRKKQLSQVQSSDLERCIKDEYVRYLGRK
jgi:hypothetical protein